MTDSSTTNDQPMSSGTEGKKIPADGVAFGDNTAVGITGKSMDAGESVHAGKSVRVEESAVSVRESMRAEENMRIQEDTWESGAVVQGISDSRQENNSTARDNKQSSNAGAIHELEAVNKSEKVDGSGTANKPDAVNDRAANTDQNGEVNAGGGVPQSKRVPQDNASDVSGGASDVSQGKEENGAEKAQTKQTSSSSCPLAKRGFFLRKLRDDEANKPKRGASQGKDGESKEGTAAKNAGKKRFSLRQIILGFFGVAVIASILWLFFGGERFAPIKTSEGIALLEGDTVRRVQITEGTQEVRLWLSKETTTIDSSGKQRPVGKTVEFEYVEAQAAEVARLAKSAQPKLGYNSVVPQTSMLSSIITMVVPLAIIFGLFMFLLPRIQSGMGGLGRIKGRKSTDPENPDVTFDDVAGEDEAVAELREVTDFLTSPDRFHALGAKIPRGVLLYGPPGTGKTLLARAVAGEAGVPFFSISASEFVEIFAGVGASRVRDLFTKAKAAAPSIIFVDEIDAVGRGRGVGIGGGADEREQTLNQLLVELDGFDARANVILIAATNRPDVLDQALLRPGRFDRQIAVDAPDLKGREAILKVHSKGKPFASDVDMEMVARRTPGYTGADLANILNEAALLAARFGHEAITVDDVDEAIDRVMAGPQRRSRPMSDQDKLLTAYHEAGHALAAAALHNADPVSKVTILPRGRALGYTMVLPTEDRYSVSRNDLLDQLTYAMGGRVAEELVFHDPTTGASNDIQKATNIARAMVTEYGMTTQVGILRLASDDSDPLMRGMGGGGDAHSDGMMNAIDVEVRALVENAHREAWDVLATNRDVLDTLAARLMEKETVLEAELAEIFASVVKAPVRERWNSYELPQEYLKVSEHPPVEIPAPAHTDESSSEGGASQNQGAQSDDGMRSSLTDQPRVVSDEHGSPEQKSSSVESMEDSSAGDTSSEAKN